MLRGIQCLRAVAALLVVTQHSIHYQQKHGRDRLPLATFDFAFSVDMLFVLSGLMIVLVNGQRGGSWSGAMTFLRKRLIRIIPLYWFYTTIIVAIAWLFPQAFDRFRLDGTHALQSYLFLPANNLEGNTLPVLVVGWTLNYEMFYYLVFAALLLLPRRLLVPALTGLFSSCVLVGAMYPPDLPLLRLMTNPLLLEFLMGAWIGWLALRGGPASARLGLLLAMAGGVALLAAGIVGIETTFGRVLWFGLPSAVVVLGVLSLDGSGFHAFPRLLVRMGDTSYSLYLSHLLVLAAVGKAWKLLGLNASCPDLLLLCTLLAASLAAAEISYRLVEDPARHLLTRLLADRERGDRCDLPPQTAIVVCAPCPASKAA